MKAIETVYKGYNFRSRVEARWAVFLDALGWNWEYEREGFEFEDGTRYLPDFFIPRINTWIEVKGQEPTEEEIKKCKMLSRKCCYVMLVVGIPEPQMYRCFYGGAEIDKVTIPSYVISKGWDAPFIIGNWYEEDMPAFDLAKSARFEFGQSGATL